MATLENRIAKLEQSCPTGAGRITTIQLLAIDHNKRCVGAYRTELPGGVQAEIFGDEFEAIRLGYEEMRLPR